MGVGQSQSRSRRITTPQCPSKPCLIRCTKFHSVPWYSRVPSELAVQLKSDFSSITTIDPRNRDDPVVYDLVDPSLHVPSELSSEAAQFTWIPAVVQAGDGGKRQSQFVSSINNMDIVGQAPLYDRLGKLLDQALPLMEATTSLPLKDRTLQVIVKAQKYVVDPTMTSSHPHVVYEGRVHKEGNHENIVASALFYYQVDPGLRGGNLLLGPSSFASGYNDKDEEGMISVPVSEGQLVVFNNEDCFHKVGPLSWFSISCRHETNNALDRGVVHPGSPCATSAPSQGTGMLE